MKYCKGWGCGSHVERLPSKCKAKFKPQCREKSKYGNKLFLLYPLLDISYVF
jgi:hypothetical protein